MWDFILRTNRNRKSAKIFWNVWKWCYLCVCIFERATTTYNREFSCKHRFSSGHLLYILNTINIKLSLTRILDSYNQLKLNCTLFFVSKKMYFLLTFTLSYFVLFIVFCISFFILIRTNYTVYSKFYYADTVYGSFSIRCIQLYMRIILWTVHCTICK